MSDTKIKIGIMGGRCDCDLLYAPGIDKDWWVKEGAGKKKDEMVHSDVAIWWHLKQNYPNVEAVLVDPNNPANVTKEALEANDINFLLGWDAVSAHIDEFAGDQFGEDDSEKPEAGFAEKIKDILRAPSSKCWPPASVQDLINMKAYIQVAEENDILVPPTIVCTEKESRSAEALIPKIQERGWKALITKPVPSSWSAGLAEFDSMKDVVADPKDLQEYFNNQESAKVILAQECIYGMEKYPETRVYWFGDEFMYSVANIKNGKITDSPESYAYADGSGTLDEKYWKPAKELGEIVKQRVLPELRGFQGQKLSSSYPWLMRIDIGMHDKGLTDKVYCEKFQKGKMTRFLNEVESAPTLYLDARFKHPINWISFYTQKCVETAYEVTGITKPEIVEEMKRKVATGMEEGSAVAKRKTISSKKAVSKKAGTTVKKPAKKAAAVKAATTKKPAKKVVTKKIAKGAKPTTTKKTSTKA